MNTTAESRLKEYRIKRFENTLRFERFLYEMINMEDIVAAIRELIGNNHDPIVASRLESRIEYTNLMIEQIKSEATEWGLTIKEDMTLLEEIIKLGAGDLDYKWIFEDCDIDCLTEHENQFERFITVLSHLDYQLSEAMRDIRDNSDVSLVLSLQEHLEDLEAVIEDTRSDAQLWGEDLGDDQPLRSWADENFPDNEWIFDYYDLD